VPAVFLVLLAAHLLLNWWERVLPRFWPSRGLDRFKDHGMSSIPRQVGAPSQRGISSMVQGDPKVLWPAEFNRRRAGWELSFEDFGAVMSAVQQSRQLREWDD
jgi:hypothetical protein